MKSNVNIENSVNCSPSSTNDLLPNDLLPKSRPESSDNRHHQAESDMKPITPPLALTSTSVVQHSKDDKALRLGAGKDSDLQDDKDAAFTTPLSPINHSPPSPLMEIIPPPLSHQLQVTTPLESSTAVDSSNINTTSTQELQSLSEIHWQHTPLTESQIDDAKGLVLDLLGWGVDPEYLVESGVHPKLIHRIFTDLNLRLPTNLVLSDDG